MVTPTIILNDGNTIPQIGFGTAFVGLEAREPVSTAIEVGYRHFDTAKAYGNDAEVGEAVRTSDVARSEMFITSKLFCDDQGYDATHAALEATLRRMGLDYLDLFLIHWPNPDMDLYVHTWRAMIDLRAEGLIRSIGVSNFEAKHVDRLVDETGVKPVVNQIELHPLLQQTALRNAMVARDVRIESWSPLVHGTLLSDPVYGEIAAKYGRSPAQVVLRWHLQHGLIVLPKAEEKIWMEQNLAITDFTLREEDMAHLDGLDRGEAGRSGPHPDSTFAERVVLVNAIIAKLGPKSHA